MTSTLNLKNFVKHEAWPRVWYDFEKFGRFARFNDFYAKLEKLCET